MKSQIGIEFLMGVIILLLIYVAALSGFNTFAKTNIIQNEAAKEACYTVSTAIGVTNMGGNGFSMNASLPYSLDSEPNYTVTVLNTSSVDINWAKSFFSCSISTQNVTNTYIYPGRFSLNNINSTVYISSISTDKLDYAYGEQVSVNGMYYINNVSLSLYLNDLIAPGYPVILTVTNYGFSYNFTPVTAGHYKIQVNDINLTSFNADREFDVV